MKDYTPVQREEAKKKLPRPVSDFLVSNTILDIYRGLVQKHALNWRQGGLVTDVVNNTLLGLESESTLETNLHQALPELSANTMRELIVDINDRILKEARRRLQENIVTPEPAWNAEELGSQKDAAAEKLISDEELDKLAEKEEKEGWKPPEEEAGAVVATAPVVTPADVGEREIPLAIPIEKPATTIAQEKLLAPVRVVKEVATTQTSGIQNVSIPKPTGNEPAKIISTPATAPAQTQTPAPTPIAPPKTPPAPPIYKGSDPYREPID